MKRTFVMVLMFVLVCICAQGATLYGTIYDLSLNKADNVILEVNSKPLQRYVAINGTYLFEIPPGSYIISGTRKDGSDLMAAKERIEIADEGVYVLDLFLYPEFNQEIIDDLDFEIDVPYGETRNPSPAWLLFPLSAVMFFFLILLVKINKKTAKTEIEEENKFLSKETKKIIELLQKNEGRITQKEIRKEFFLSEAKISLMIAELESLKIIKKIKKGRSNIILLSEDYFKK